MIRLRIQYTHVGYIKGFDFVDENGKEVSSVEAANQGAFICPADVSNVANLIRVAAVQTSSRTQPQQRTRGW